MAGPDSPNHTVGADRPPFTEPYPSQPLPRQPAYTSPSANTAPPRRGGYPGFLPPPASYPRRHRRRLVIGVLVTVVLVAALTGAVVYGALHSAATAHGAISDAAAKTAIQGYLDALEHRDIDAIASNTLCGIYDAVRDKRSDEALARLSSDAFRKQFSQAEVTSIDKLVYWSPYQAHVLFSMRVAAANGGPPRDGVQGVAQLLVQQRQILVCSYVLHTAGTY